MKMMEFKVFARNPSKVIKELGRRKLKLTVDGKPVAMVVPVASMSRKAARDLEWQVREARVLTGRVPIKTDRELDAALKEVERIWDSKNGSADNDRLDLLATRIETYEKKNWPAFRLAKKVKA